NLEEKGAVARGQGKPLGRTGKKRRVVGSSLTFSFRPTDTTGQRARGHGSAGESLLWAPGEQCRSNETMRNGLLGWLCLALLSGCCRPLQIETHSKVRIEPLEGGTRVVTDPSPVPDSGPVKAMVVDGPGCSGPGRIALIDVDGILLNAD